MKKINTSIELMKYISIISMLIDHVGLILLDGNDTMRFLGRFALVGFSFVLAHNYKYSTSDRRAYKKRLLIWALISQAPFMLFIGSYLNILFLLLAGLIAIDAIELIKSKYKIIRPALYLTGALVTSLYAGAFIFGITTIVLMYYTNSKKSFALLFISVALMNYNLIYGLAALISLNLIYFIMIVFIMDNYLVGVKPLEIKRIKGIWFYAFYPVHIIIIGIVGDIKFLY